MAKITWKGEDHLHHDERGGPRSTTAYGGIKFPKGEPVVIHDPVIIAKAKTNSFFDVADDVIDQAAKVGHQAVADVKKTVEEMKAPPPKGAKPPVI